MFTNSRRPFIITLAALGLFATSCSSASTVTPGPSADSVPWPITECGTYSGEGCAPVDQLVDLDKPTFSDPTSIDNPYYPIGDLESVVLLGSVDDLPFRSETTLLPYTNTIVWDGDAIEVALVQYLAYSDGRITEVAIDRYAQADDGSVWYFGEDVYDYTDGTVSLTEGTWLAGRDGSPAMIMPADPKVGDVFRSETVLGIVFEELTVTEVDVTMDGPSGPVAGVIVASELHLDESRSDKLFAPGYGEFDSEHDGDIEALAVARQVDALDSAEPPALRELLTAAWGAAEAARMEDWEGLASIVGRIEAAATSIAPVTPPRVAAVLAESRNALAAAIADEDADATVQAVIEIGQSTLDVKLRFAPAFSIDVARIHLHAEQLRLDAATGNRAGVDAEVATIEWLHQRIEQHLPEADRDHIDSQLDQLRLIASSGNLAVAADIATRLAADASSVAASVPG